MATLDRVLLALNPDGLVVTDRHGRVLSWSEGATNIFGFSATDVVGQELAGMTVPADRIDEHRVMLDKVASVGTARCETVRRCKDGSLIHIDILARAVEVDGNDCVLWAKRDITEPKVQREAIRLETRFGDMLDSAPDAMLAVDETGRILLGNANAEQIFGYTRHELRGLLIESLLPGRFRDNHLRHRTRYLDRPRVRAMGADLQLRGLRKNGEEFPVEVSLSPLKTQTATIVMSAVRDITDRQRANERFRGLLEAAPDAIVIVEPGGRIVLANTQADLLFGYRRDDLVGQNVEMLLPESFRGLHAQHRGGYFTQPRVRSMGDGRELYARRSDGTEFPVEISLSPLNTGDGVLASAAIRDITERKQVERKLQEQNLELVNANRAKSQFLASMSHELRTPLNAIIGFTGTLLMGLPGPLTAEQEKQLHMIERSGLHLLALINDLLDLTRIEAGRVEVKLARVDSNGLVKEAVERIRGLAAAKELEVDFQPSTGAAAVMTDERIMLQILLNLLGNAVKYTERGGVRVQVETIVENDSAKVRIGVSDTGIGILEADHERLFKAFSQLGRPNRTPEGAGLGLFLSARMAELIGGRIDFKSSPGAGSTFSLTLPVA